MSNLKHSVLNEIKKQGLKPTSKFYFLSKKYFYWLLAFASVVIGAFAFSSIIFQLVIETDVWGGIRWVNQPGLFFQSVPLFWLGLLVLFTLSAWFNFKSIESHHRTEHATVVLGSILISLLLGLLLFSVGLTEKLETSIRSSVPLYRVIVENKMDRKADFVDGLDADSYTIRLKREQLRTVCLNQGREDCFTTFDTLTNEELAQQLATSSPELELIHESDIN